MSNKCDQQEGQVQHDVAPQSVHVKWECIITFCLFFETFFMFWLFECYKSYQKVSLLSSFFYQIYVNSVTCIKIFSVRSQYQAFQKLAARRCKEPSFKQSSRTHFLSQTHVLKVILMKLLLLVNMAKLFWSMSSSLYFWPCLEPSDMQRHESMRMMALLQLKWQSHPKISGMVQCRNSGNSTILTWRTSFKKSQTQHPNWRGPCCKICKHLNAL